MKMFASSRLVCTHLPTPVRVRSKSAIDDREREQVARGEIGDRDTDPHRALPRQSGDRHEPAHALHDLIDAGALAVGAGLAEAADAAVDDARIHLRTSSYDTSRRCFTSARMFSTITSAFSTSFMNTAWPSGVFRFELHRALVAMEVLEIEAVAAAGLVFARSSAARCGSRSRPSRQDGARTWDPRAPASGRGR